MTSVIRSGGKINIRVSSVLNKDNKSFGKNNILDGKEDTCWNSDEGTPQWVSVTLELAQEIASFTIQFQGGFVGRECRIELNGSENELIHSENFYPEDINTEQTFKLSKSITAKYILFMFDKSTDFFGRIVIYSIDIFST